MPSDHNGIKVEVSNKMIVAKVPEYLEVNIHIQITHGLKKKS